jgi:quinol-cytochrome oxidoreductase complex cytochrome b subunit
MSSVDERRAEFTRYKQDVKERGKPFFPYAMFHDTVMSLVVVCVITGLAIIWKYGLFGDHVLGSLLGPEADPGTRTFVPRPDWYFYFLFYLLRIFKWPDSVILGTVGIPTIIMVLLIALPFMADHLQGHMVRMAARIAAG